MHYLWFYTKSSRFYSGGGVQVLDHPVYTEQSLNIQGMIISWLLGEVWAILIILVNFCLLGMPKSCPNLPKILVVTITLSIMIKFGWNFQEMFILLLRGEVCRILTFWANFAPWACPELAQFARKWVFSAITPSKMVKHGWNFHKMFISLLRGEVCTILAFRANFASWACPNLAQNCPRSLLWK